MNMPNWKASPIALAILVASQANAGGFDNSSRDFNIIYGDNDVVAISYGQTNVPMKAQIEQGAGSSNVVASGEVLDTFKRPQIGVRIHTGENTVCAAQYEVPFAAGVVYKDDQLAYGSTTAPISTKYDSKSFTVACGYDFPLSTGKLTVFGGPKIQEISGAFDEDLTPYPSGHALTGKADNLTVNLNSDPDFGFIAGVAYSIPDIALRASLLYHSQIDHDVSGSLTTLNPTTFAPLTTTATSKTFTPQTIELALQSGIAENTLAFVKVRWSEYSKLSSLDVVDGYNAVNPSVDMFSNDTLDYSFGLGRQLTDQLQMGVSFSGGIKIGSTDAPLGADSSSLRLPGDTTHTIGLGGEYAVMPKLSVSAGLGYTFINAYTVETTTGSYRAEFSKTQATSLQLGLTYQL